MNESIVRSSHHDLIAHGKALHDGLRRCERDALGRAVELGQVLRELKARCASGEWGAALEQMGVARQRAWEYLQVAALSAAEVAACGSLREALARAEARRPAPDVAPGAPPAPDEDAEPGDGLMPPRVSMRPDEEGDFEGAGGEGPEYVYAPPTREPGDDTEQLARERAEEKALPKNGSPLFDWKKADELIGKVHRLPDEIADAYGAAEAQSPEFASCQDAMRGHYRTFQSWKVRLTRCK